MKENQKAIDVIYRTLRANRDRRLWSERQAGCAKFRLASGCPRDAWSTPPNQCHSHLLMPNIESSFRFQRETFPIMVFKGFVKYDRLLRQYSQSMLTMWHVNITITLFLRAIGFFIGPTQMPAPRGAVLGCWHLCRANKKAYRPRNLTNRNNNKIVWTNIFFWSNKTVLILILIIVILTLLMWLTQTPEGPGPIFFLLCTYKYTVAIAIQIHRIIATDLKIIT